MVSCQLALHMVEIAFGNGRISKSEGLVTLTLYRVILHTVVHHSSTSTYMQNFIEIEETFSGRTDGRLHERTFETSFVILNLSKSRLNNNKLALYGTDGRFFTTDVSANFKVM